MDVMILCSGFVTSILNECIFSNLVFALSKELTVDCGKGWTKKVVIFSIHNVTDINGFID